MDKLGISQNILSSEILNHISTEKTTEFLIDFLSYLVIVKSHDCKNVNDVTSTCEHLFEQYTKPFFEKWEFLPNLSWHSGYIKRYSSFILSYTGVNLILPHRFLIYNLLNPENTIIDQLQCSKSIDLFFLTLNKIFRDSNLNLLENDLNIIQFFFNPFLQEKIPSIPTNRQIAQSIGCSENTVSRRIGLLYKKSILSHKYRVNMAKLGFYTSLIVHINLKDSIPLKFESCCLADIPIDWGESMARLKIFQIHSSNKSICKEIKDFFNPLYEVTLTKSTIGWNLKGLTLKREQRWKDLPPVLQSDRWDDQYLSRQYRIDYELLPINDGLVVSKTQAKMLDVIQKETTSNFHLSNILQVGQKYIKRFYDDLFAKKLIRRFTVLMNIGLQSKVCITLLGSQSNPNLDMLKKIVEHLKSFPSSYLLYNDKNLDIDRKLVLVGLLWMPSSWLEDFYRVWIYLQNYGFIPKFNINQGVIKWGTNILDTYSS